MRGLARHIQITLVAVIFLIGIVVGRLGINVELSWILIPLLPAIFTRKQKLRLFFGLILGAVLVFGIWRGYRSDFSRSYLSQYIDKKVVLVGIVGDDPGVDRYGNYTFDLSDVRLDNVPVGYPVKIKSISTGLGRGYQVKVEGKLRPALGVVPVQISFAQVEVVSSKVSWLETTRQKFFAAIRTCIPAPMNGFGLGLLVGARSLIPNDLQDDMSAVGLSHLVAASGYNLTVLVMAMRRIFGTLSIFAATAAGGWLIIAFLIISGFSAAIFRAAIVSLIGMLTAFYGYKVHPFTLLSLPAIITVGWNPDFLMRDLGWQLSFTAFYGVLVLAPLIEERWVRHHSMVKSLLIESTCAHILTMPLIMWRFENVSIISPIANLFVVPLIPVAMLLSFIVGLAGMLLPPGMAALAALPTTGLLGFCVGAAQWFAGLPFAQSQQALNGVLVAIFYGLIAIFSWILGRRGTARLEIRDSLLGGTIAPGSLK